MPEFLSLITPEEALALLFEKIQPTPAQEVLPAAEALGRVLAEDIRSAQDLPSFRRSTVDGYAVSAKDTHGASESLPAYLKLAGEIPMGSDAGLALTGKDCALIHTGGMLPAGADAVVMLEDTQTMSEDEIEIFRGVARGENLIEIGEDVKSGQIVIASGTRLRPAEIGGLMALGIQHVTVAVPPRIGIISSGDEVVPPEQAPGPGQVRDINTYTLSALIQELGGEAVHYGIIPDSREALLKHIKKALNECDHIIVTAGSSASTRDLTAEVMNELGDPGVFVQGVNIKPGKPTILGLAGDQVMIGLPGNPVSALVIAFVLVKPILLSYLGLRKRSWDASIPAVLTMNVPSQAGREDWVPVKLAAADDGTYQAGPIFGRSNLIFILAEADGLIKIPSAATGITAGTEVTVRLI